MKQILLSIAQYRQWADTVLLKELKTFSPEILTRDMGSSFGNIINTLFHIYKGDNNWWQRIQLKENIIPASEELAKNFDQLSAEILKMSGNWVNLVKDSSDMKLEHVFEYRDSKRVAHKQPLYEVLIQIFNHQTYHHGQITTMLRQQLTDKLAATDYIVFTRTKGKIS